MVFVSRRPCIPVRGSMTFTQSVASASGDSVVPLGWNFLRSGSRSGNSVSGTDSIVPSSRWMIGIGSPQYRCREKSQSRSLNWTALFPRLRVPSHATDSLFGLWRRKAVQRHFGIGGIDSRSIAGARLAVITLPPDTTSTIGSEYFFAKAKSRSSCPGTAMIAPVPYPIRT